MYLDTTIKTPVSIRVNKILNTLFLYTKI